VTQISPKKRKSFGEGNQLPTKTEGKPLSVYKKSAGIQKRSPQEKKFGRRHPQGIEILERGFLKKKAPPTKKRAP